MPSIVEQVMRTVNLEQAIPVPVALWDLAPWMPSMLQVNALKYYQDIATKLHVQTEIQRLFPEAILFPGIFPDYGVVMEASATGSAILWLDDDAPFAQICIHSAQEVKRLKPADPYRDGLLPRILEEWQYLWKHTEPWLIKDYGYMEGHVLLVGPLETAGLVRGYDGLFLDMYDHPALVHQLLDILTETNISWGRAQEKINGPARRLFIIDHMSTQLSPELYREFFHPYLKRLFNEFNYAEIRLWHNEGRSQHIFEFIPDLGCNVYQFGEDAVNEIKAALGDKLCLMGNLHSVEIIRNLTPEQVRDVSRETIRHGAAGGGFLLSGAGGLAPKTPVDNVRAMIEATFVAARQ